MALDLRYSTQPPNSRFHRVDDDLGTTFIMPSFSLPLFSVPLLRQERTSLASSLFGPALYMLIARYFAWHIAWPIIAIFCAQALYFGYFQKWLYWRRKIIVRVEREALILHKQLFWTTRRRWPRERIRALRWTDSSIVIEGERRWPPIGVIRGPHPWDLAWLADILRHKLNVPERKPKKQTRIGELWSRAEW